MADDPLANPQTRQGHCYNHFLCPLCGRAHNLSALKARWIWPYTAGEQLIYTLEKALSSDLSNSHSADIAFTAFQMFLMFL